MMNNPQSTGLSDIQRAARELSKERTAEELARLLMDDSWSTYGVFEEMASDYENGSPDFRRGMDNVLTALTGWTLASIARSMLASTDAFKED